MNQICVDCKCEYPLNGDYFHKNRSKKTGYSNRCKKCANINSLKWVANNKDKFRINQKRGIDNRLEKGCCKYCNSKRMYTHNRLCEKHYLMEKSNNYFGTTKKWGLLKEKLVRQNFLCVYSHENIILGYNDSIDHIKPASKFLELKSDINNLQWVIREVNFMKDNLTEDRFFELINKILKIRQEAVGSNACGDEAIASSVKQEAHWSLANG